jgi:hypothetical protein
VSVEPKPSSHAISTTEPSAPTPLPLALRVARPPPAAATAQDQSNPLRDARVVQPCSARPNRASSSVPMSASLRPSRARGGDSAWDVARAAAARGALADPLPRGSPPPLLQA